MSTAHDECRRALTRESDLTDAELRAKAAAILWCLRHPSFDPVRDTVPKVRLRSTLDRWAYLRCLRLRCLR